MNISEFAKPVTAKSLNESLARRFGQRIKLENFTLAQLQDARNKLRTRLSQVEMAESFNTVIESENYQKSKLFLDVLNAEIAERGDIEQTPVQEKRLREGAEDQAEIVMAAKDMVDRVTNWMEDTAEMQTESMLELADAIRDEMGADQSAQFVDAVKPALEALYGSMEQAREALSLGVGMLTGEQVAPAAMGADGELPPVEDEMAADAEMEPTVDMEAGAGDAAAAAAGGTEPAGRPTRESINRSKKKISEGNDPQTSRIIRGFIQELKKTDPQMSYKVQDLATETKRQTNDDKAVWYAIADHPEFGKYLDQYYDTINTGKNNPAAGGNLQRGFSSGGQNPPAAGYNLMGRNPASAPAAGGTRESIDPRRLATKLATSLKKK
jgi:hypothetical protein